MMDSILVSGLLVTLIGLLCICLVQFRDRQFLKKEVTKLNDALNHVSSYIYIKERGQKYTYGNKATLELFGVSASKIVGATDDQFFSPDTVSKLLAVDSEVFDSSKVSHEEIFSGSDPHTQTVYWEVKHPLRNKSGDIVGLVGISTDVTEVHRLRHELERRASTDGLTLASSYATPGAYGC
jgi:PAS domain S-box-containing protein